MWTSHTSTPIKEVAAQVTGSIPSWLRGTLIRNGPAQFEVGADSFRHWFDGLAHVLRFTITSTGSVLYLSSPLLSSAYRLDTARGRIAVSEFATPRSDDPCDGLFARFVSKFRPSDAADNANISAVQFGHRVVALQERRHGLTLDPSTLTTSPCTLGQGIAGQTTTAHPHFSTDGRTVFNLATHYGPRSTYTLFSHDAVEVEGKARTIASIPVARPGYIHSFGQTEHYLVLVEFPLTTHPMTMGLMNVFKRSYIECFDWRGQDPTRVFVVEKTSGRVVGPYTAPACFAFHHINAYEEAGDGGVTLHVDVAAYDDATVIDSLYLDNLRHQSKAIPRATVRRFSLVLPASPATRPATPAITPRVLYPYQLELPRIAYSLCSGRPYRFVYGLGHDDHLSSAASSVPMPVDAGAAVTLFTRIVKLDVTAGEAVEWRGEGCHPSEPLLVLRPGAGEEDDGVVLSVVLEPGKGESFLLVLDAKTLKEVARATVTGVLPFGLHGCFVDGAGGSVNTQ